MKDEKKTTIFEGLINRLEAISSRNAELSLRAYSKSVRIAGIIDPKVQGEQPKRDDSLVGNLETLMDCLDASQNTFEQVVIDLENAIP